MGRRKDLLLEVVRVDSYPLGLGVLTKRKKRSFIGGNLDRDAYTQAKDCEGSKRAQPGLGREASGEASPPNTSIVDFKPQNCETIVFCCLSHPVCGVLLWQS